MRELQNIRRETARRVREYEDQLHRMQQSLQRLIQESKDIGVEFERLFLRHLPRTTEFYADMASFADKAAERKDLRSLQRLTRLQKEGGEVNRRLAQQRERIDDLKYHLDSARTQLEAIEDDVRREENSQRHASERRHGGEPSKAESE
ncbi:hypothetical protein NLU13_9435 [Sarocladium strictum]|uniref:Uncharacterized protein n=1 Tax=Sarocladium strictum TaxID=5046 RepID=A0AA39L4F0_SARSR|nr:hypothetical protein NLU13_9435 [Sarocladium strictum]